MVWWWPQASEFFPLVLAKQCGGCDCTNPRSGAGSRSNSSSGSSSSGSGSTASSGSGSSSSGSGSTASSSSGSSGRDECGVHCTALADPTPLLPGHDGLGLDLLHTAEEEQQGLTSMVYCWEAVAGVVSSSSSSVGLDCLCETPASPAQ